MKNFAATLAVSVAFAFGNIAAPAGATVLDPFLVFGDSLSDAGYFGQQATNGNTWAAQLGATTVSFSPSYNFAQGGARASGDNTGLPALDPKDFSEQIAVFDTVAPAVSPDTWAVVWFGGNDFLNTAAEVIGSGLNLNDPNDQATAFAQVQMAATDAIDAIASGILALELRSIRNILVPGLPDLGSLPQFSDPLLAALAPLASEASQDFNTALIGTVSALDALPTLNVVYFDTAGLFSRIVGNSPGNGFTATTDSCAADGALPACTGYLFFDGVHPTNEAHGILASQFARILPPAVPLPAGWILILTAGGVLGFVRRRQTCAA